MVAMPQVAPAADAPHGEDESFEVLFAKLRVVPKTPEQARQVQDESGQWVRQTEETHNLELFRDRFPSEIDEAWEATGWQREAMPLLLAAVEQYAKDTGVRLRINPKAETVEEFVTLEPAAGKPEKAPARKKAPARPRSKGINYAELTSRLFAAGYGPAIRLRIGKGHDATLNPDGSVSVHTDAGKQSYPTPATWLQTVYTAEGKEPKGNPLKAVMIANKTGAEPRWLNLESANKHVGAE